MSQLSRSGEDFAGPWFEARRKESALDWELYEKLCGLFGDGAVADNGCDEYDWSLEVYMTDKVPADWACSELQRDVILSWGFARFWINFSDDTTEQYCDAERLGKRGPRNRPARKFEKRQPVTPASETQGQEAEQARRFRLIQSAYANEYRLRDSIKAEMKEAGERGDLMMNGQCRDWNAYVQAIARREEIVEEVVNAANR